MNFPIELTCGMKIEYDGSKATVLEDITLFDIHTPFHVISEGVKQVWIWSIEDIDCTIVEKPKRNISDKTVFLWHTLDVEVPYKSGETVHGSDVLDVVGELLELGVNVMISGDILYIDSKRFKQS